MAEEGKLSQTGVDNRYLTLKCVDTDQIIFDGEFTKGGIVTAPVFLHDNSHMILFGEGRNLFTLNFPKMDNKTFVLSLNAPITNLYALQAVDKTTKTSVISSRHYIGDVAVIALIDSNSMVHLVNVKMTVAENDSESTRNKYEYSHIYSYAHSECSTTIKDVLVFRNIENEILIISIGTNEGKVELYKTVLTADGLNMNPTKRLLEPLRLGVYNGCRQVTVCNTGRYLVGCYKHDSKSLCHVSAFIYDIVNCRVASFRCQEEGEVIRCTSGLLNIDKKNCRLALARSRDVGEVFIFDLGAMDSIEWRSEFDITLPSNMGSLHTQRCIYTTLAWHAHSIRDAMMWLDSTTLCTAGHEGALVQWTIANNKWSKMVIPIIGCIAVDLIQPGYKLNNMRRLWILARRADNSIIALNTAHKPCHRYGGIALPLSYLQYHCTAIDPMSIGYNKGFKPSMKCDVVHINGAKYTSGPYELPLLRKGKDPLMVDINPVNNISLFDLNNNISIINTNADAHKLDGVPKRYFGGNKHCNYPYEVQQVIQIGKFPLLLYVEGRQSMTVPGLPVDHIQRFRLFTISDSKQKVECLEPFQDIEHCHNKRIVYVGYVGGHVVSIDCEGNLKLWLVKIVQEQYKQSRMNTRLFYHILDVANITGQVIAAHCTVSSKDPNKIYIAVATHRHLLLAEHSNMDNPSATPTILSIVDVSPYFNNKIPCVVLPNVKLYDRGSTLIVTCCNALNYFWYSFNKKNDEMKLYVPTLPPKNQIRLKCDSEDLECIILDPSVIKEKGKNSKRADVQQEIILLSVNKKSVEQIRSIVFNSKWQIINSLLLDGDDGTELWIHTQTLEWIKVNIQK